MARKKPTVIVTRTLPRDVETRMMELFEARLNAQDAPMSADEIIAAAEGADVLVPTVTDKIDADLIARLPDSVELIANFGVGVNHIDLDAARQRGIPVGNTPNLVDGATADMTFGLILATARNMIVGDHFARSDQFTHYDPRLFTGTEVHGTTLGVVGLGNIGYQVAKRALGFDMKILCHNRKRSQRGEEDLGAQYCALDDLLQKADFVVLTVPLTPETRGLIGARELKLMKKSAILVNTARGGVVDHQALLEALQQGTITGAGLDVTEPEPLPRDHPLLELENVVIMPHLGSATRQTRLAMAQLTADNLLAGLEGRDLLTPIA